MLTRLLSQSTLDHLQQIKTDFKTAKPFKHVIIDGFFKPDFCQSLLNEFPDFKAEDAIDENKTVGKKAVVQGVSQIGQSYRELDQLVKSDDFLSLISEVTGIPDLLYDPHYIGGGTHNNMDGQELDPHVDFTHHPLTSHHRRLNLIVYLNHQWQQDWGGNIEFHKNPRLSPDDDDIISVRPLFNRAVIFETNNHSWHGFPPIDLPQDKKQISRKSFALYYYTHHRQEQIEPHSTIYVERHLPDKITEDKVLSAADVSEIKTLLARRDQHLERLYKTITEQTKEISQLKTQILRLKTLGSNTDKQSQLIERQMELLSYDETRLINRIQELESSTSWKITAPLRAIKRFLSKR